MRRAAVAGLALLALVVVWPARAEEPLASLARLAAAYASVESYTARLERQEVVADELRPREEILLKFRRPGLMYLKWVAGPPRGREILFVPGRDDGRMLVREPGLFTGLATIVMAPDSSRVLEESRHPVTDIGIGRLIDLIMDNARRAAAHGELVVRDLSEGSEPDGPVHRLEAILPRDPARGYYCYRIELSVAEDSGLPVRAVIHDWSDRVVAEYAYRQLRLNPPRDPADFDPANPDYGFPHWRVSG